MKICENYPVRGATDRDNSRPLAQPWAERTYPTGIT
jgi:hypothetical protein